MIHFDFEIVLEERKPDTKRTNILKRKKNTECFYVYDTDMKRGWLSTYKKLKMNIKNPFDRKNE